MPPTRSSAGYPTWLRLGWLHSGLIIVLIMALSLTFLFGIRSYRTLVLLQSAQQLAVVETSSIRAWMTLRYVAATYDVDEDELVTQLQLPTGIDRQVTLRSLAEKQGLSPFNYVRVVQAAIAEIAALQHKPESIEEPKGWLDTISEGFLSAVLVYGYPALALILFLGAIGAPVPTGLSTTVAGSLASQGHLSWQWTIALAVGASVLGDLVGYGLGRMVSGTFLERYGRLFGYTSANRARVEVMFVRWGAIAVLLTRTLASHLSSVVSILAGVSRFRLASFLAFAVVGRIIWTAAYFELGYLVGADLEAASGFLANLSVFLILLVIFLGTATALVRLGTPRSAHRD